MNDGIETELCKHRYTFVDEAVGMVLSSVDGTVMAKFDIESILIQ